MDLVFPHQEMVNLKKKMESGPLRGISLRCPFHVRKQWMSTEEDAWCFTRYYTSCHPGMIPQYSFSALLLAGKRLRRIIPWSVQTCQYTGFARIKFLSRNHPAGTIAIDLAVCKLAALITKLVYCSADLRYVRPAHDIQTMTGSQPTVRPAGIYCRDCRRDCCRCGSTIRQACGTAGNQ